MLSQVVYTDEGTIECSLTLSEILDEFYPNVDRRKTRAAISQLIADKLVKEVDGVLELGTYDNDSTYFYDEVEKEEVNLTKEKEVLSMYLKSYLASSKKLGKTPQADYCNEGLAKLMGRDFETFNVYDFENLWKIVHEIVFQDSPRIFERKERGQIGHLLTLYSKPKLVKMLLVFLTSTESFVSKNASPNIGLFMFHKDNVYKKSFGVDLKTKEALKYEEKEVEETSFA